MKSLRKLILFLIRYRVFYERPIIGVLALLVQYGFAWCMEEPIYKNIKNIGWIFSILCICNLFYVWFSNRFPYIVRNKIVHKFLFTSFVVFVFYPLILFLLKLLLPFIMGPIGSIYVLYYTYPILFIMASISFVMLILYCIIYKYCIHPIVRMILLIVAELFPIIIILSNILMLINADDLFSPKNREGIIDLIIMSLVVFSLALPIVFMDKRKLYGLLPFRKYILYLRSFCDGNELDFGKIISGKYKYKLVEIADPTAGNKKINFDGYDFYLPTKNWKPQLRYYISRAKFVICSIGITDGVQWEMFENDSHISKYVFVSGHIEELNIDSFNLIYKDHEIYEVLKNAKKIFGCGTVCFCFYNHCWYFSRNVCKILECLSNSDFSGISVRFNSNLTTQNKSLNKSWWLVDLFRYFWMIIRPKKLSQITMATLLGPFAILCFVFPFIMVLFGVFSLICLCLDYFGFSTPIDSDISLGGCIFGIVFGIKMIRDMFDK